MITKIVQFTILYEHLTSFCQHIHPIDIHSILHLTLFSPHFNHDTVGRYTIFGEVVLVAKHKGADLPNWICADGSEPEIHFADVDFGGFHCC